MDFPLFHLDVLNNRLLIAVIAIVHVVINHPFAVGATLLLSSMEARGISTGDKRWDELAYKILFVCFVLTTTVGAMTGVGIWFSAALINPASIGSLIRVFFWGWFTEWIIFVLEVLSILVYFLTWKTMTSPEQKLKHLRIGRFLAAFSWFTMAIIVAILGFMMDPGNWMTDRSFLTGVLNPLYLPQLLFRTGFAMITAGLMALFLTYFFTKNDEEFRPRVMRYLANWVLAWLPVCMGGGFWYWLRVPGFMKDNMAVAMASQSYEQWHNRLGMLVLFTGIFIFAGAVVTLMKPRQVPRVAMLVPFVLAVALLGYFERIREFIRKPYVIGEYMYANGIREADYAVLQEEGILKHATYVRHRDVTKLNMLEAGEDVFMIACSRCHTSNGLGGVTAKVRHLFGEEVSPMQLKMFMKNMHNSRAFMPPFPGNDEELEALTAFLLDQLEHPRQVGGAQNKGISIPSKANEAETERAQLTNVTNKTEEM